MKKKTLYFASLISILIQENEEAAQAKRSGRAGPPPMNGVGGYGGFGGYSEKDREKYGLNDSVPKGAALRLGRKTNEELPFLLGNVWREDLS